MAYIKQSNILTNPLSSESIILTRDTPHLLSHLGEQAWQVFPFLPNHILEFSSSTQKRASPLAISGVSPNATFAFLLFIPQIVAQIKHRSQSTMKLLNYSTLHVFNANYPAYLKIRYIPGPHLSFSMNIWKWRTDTDVVLSSICHYSFPWWTNGAWVFETVETKSMKGTISHFSTWHDGILQQWIRCKVHESAIAFSFHPFRILEEKLW